MQTKQSGSYGFLGTSLTIFSPIWFGVGYLLMSASAPPAVHVGGVILTAAGTVGFLAGIVIWIYSRVTGGGWSQATGHLQVHGIVWPNPIRIRCI
jgi:hypothetical protein